MRTLNCEEMEKNMTTSISCKESWIFNDTSRYWMY